MKKSDYIEIFNYLLELYPEPKTELEYNTPYQLLVAVMLSAQATDKQVNKITQHFFKILKEPKDAIKLWQEQIEEQVKSINYFRSKAKHIYIMSQQLLELTKWNKKLSKKEQEIYNTHWYYIPEQREELVKLAGVGEKTAKVIEATLFDKPVIAVDTHVQRVANRLWMVKTNNPLETSKLIDKKIPKEYRTDANHVMVLFGRYYCKAQNPKCSWCKLQNRCLYFKQLEKNN